MALTLSQSTGTLSGSSVDVSIPANATRCQIFVWNATVDAATSYPVIYLRKSAVSQTASIQEDYNQGGTQDFLTANSSICVSDQAAVGQIHGLYLEVRGLDDAAVNTTFDGFAGNAENESRDRRGWMDTAQVEDTFRMESSVGNWTGGNYVFIFEVNP